MSLLLALTGAVAVRRGLDGWPGATSKTAGLVFAGLLLASWWLARSVLSSSRTPRDEPRRSPAHALGAGLVGAALLCAGPLLFHLSGPDRPLPIAWFPAWAAVVAAVAITEELVLRGTLWDALTTGPALTRPRREVLALVVSTLAFAALHVPFYGWESMPVNLAAGVVLGGLRLATGTVLAPAVTHTVADLAGWFLL